CRSHIVGAEPAGKNQPGAVEAVEPFPWKPRPRAAVTRRPGVEQIIIRGKPGQPLDRRSFLQAKRLDDRQSPTAAEFRALFAVKLQRAVQPSTAVFPCADRPLDCAPRRVDEQRHVERLRRQARDDLARFFRRDRARARRIEIESQHVGAELEGFLRVGEAGDAANFDLDGHGINRCPAKALSIFAPAPAGTSGASRSVTAISTAKVLRSRLLMPTSVAPAASAASNSFSVCTSISESSASAAAWAQSSRSKFGSSIAAISKIASAPKLFASTT